MARRRRKKRRSATRSTASLLALALPAPLQRLASSPFGPLLMFLGLPAMLVAGLLQVDWENGAPHLKVNPEKASELGQVVQDRLGNLPGHTTVEQWQQTARETWNSHVQNSPQQNYAEHPSQPPSTGPGNFPVGTSPGTWAAPTSPPSAASTPHSNIVNPYTRAPFPSTKPPGFVSTTNNNQPVANQAWGQPTQQHSPSQSAPQQQYAPQQQQQQQQYAPEQQYQPQQQYAPQQQYQHPPFPAQIPWQAR